MQNYDISILRHSCAHLLAQAIYELHPDTIFTLGPSTETGFFYDLLPSVNFKESDLEIITLKMKEIVKRDTVISHKYVSKTEALELFKDNIFKLEIIHNQIKEDYAGLTTQDSFIDLCKGGHVPSMKYVEHFLLTGISGSYWRGNRENQVLQRISGVVFNSKKELDDYIFKKEAAEKYDHRKIGKELDLFSFQDEGVGFPFIHPRGMVTINVLRDLIQEETKKLGFTEVITPTMLSSSLWKRSGHYAHYKDNMYFSQIDEQEYAIKPMNCPGAFLIYGSRPRSYRELPLRLSEFGHVHRHELSGTLHGLFRVRAFTQDDAHLFCRIEDIEQEVSKILSSIDHILEIAGFKDVELCLSTKPEKAFGDDALWNQAIDLLKNSLDGAKKTYHIKEGDGAFYGPKIEVKIKDFLDRLWTCGTIQLDFFQSENFNLTYIDSDGTHKRPVIIHQAMLGSLERFFGILLEHHKGILPFYFNPIQVRVLPISDDQKTYANFIMEFLKSNNIRVEMDQTSDPLNAKILNSQRLKVSYMVILGKKEVEQKTVSLRNTAGKQENGIALQNLLEKLI